MNRNLGETGLWWLPITLLGGALLIRVAETIGSWTFNNLLEGILIIVAIAAVTVCIYLDYQNRHIEQDTQSSPQDSTEPRISIPPGMLRVYKVIDGDTIKTINNSGVIQNVRLIGIDSPETVHPDKLIEYWGPEASAALAEKLISKDTETWTSDDTASLVGMTIFNIGKNVRLTSDETQGLYDMYDRLLAYVWLEDGTFVNEWLVRNGHAREWTYHEPCKKRDRLLAAEAEARRARCGMWAN